ncbi:hypothetical protein N7533_001979 [Penicillium manginii]|uniref:uncharacterized protein n=1 Tax=Penicillium manginii TaxID=203109 RepID=UPI0025477057|nr:uncharacterized protein N7533_001979 [Penicillium manginii]KAJ5763298.1 hypothetical protein N7533_001979 [Penicillium manginii]
MADMIEAILFLISITFIIAVGHSAIQADGRHGPGYHPGHRQPGTIGTFMARYSVGESTMARLWRPAEAIVYAPDNQDHEHQHECESTPEPEPDPELELQPGVISS